MTKRTVTIELASGLEARPIAMLVQLASSYESRIYVQSDNKKVNAKSIMGMMTLNRCSLRLTEQMKKRRSTILRNI